MEMAIIGLGKMGKEIALQAISKGIRVVGYRNPPVELKDAGLVEAADLKDLVDKTTSPRKIFLYVPAGSVVEEYIRQFGELLEEGDILIDGGNSYWGDSIRRNRYLAEKRIHFLDMGTSGGVYGARTGACFMVGGEKEAYESIAGILDKLSVPEGYAYIGPSGCGHLVKLIHNGIEFGMLQAIGEGMALLERFRELLPINMNEVLKVYQNGSVIRSWLIDLMAREYAQKGGLGGVPDYIEDTGEVNWLINDAIHLEVPVPVIVQSVIELFRSRDSKDHDYRSIAMMRHGFGGHPFGPSEFLRKERAQSRISPGFPESFTSNN